MTRLLALPTLLLFLVGCGGESTEVAVAQADDTSTFYDLAYKHGDVEAFRFSLWDNLKADNRCGGCHGEGGDETQFVQNNYNDAYDLAFGLVNLESPSSSEIVSKVENGHQCWSSCDDNAGRITDYIREWAGDTNSTSGVIQFDTPPDTAPGDSKSFPDLPGVFATSIYPLLVDNCADCHAESAPTPQAPFISNADVAAAYAASRDKIDLDTPANSRLVVRLRQEFHNCWDDNCQANADEMQAAIAAFADSIPLTEIDQQLILSKALMLGEGALVGGNKRYQNYQIAFYEFKEGSGSIVEDTSGVLPRLDLILSGSYSWVNGWGIEFSGGKAKGSTSSSQKLTALIRASGAYSIEAWVTPTTVTQVGPARIISYSAGNDARNFTLGQTLYNYEFLHRSSTTDVNGEPSLATADDDEVLQATQQHVVITFDSFNGRRIYVNGRDTGDIDPSAGGNLADWDDSFALVLGSEVTDDNEWNGKLRLVAIHNRALTPAQIEQNFLASVGQKFFLPFDISKYVSPSDLESSYIVFEAEMYDSYSYYFSKPRYIYQGDGESLDNVAIEGIRIGINGREAKAGQAFDKVNATLERSLYDEETGQQLSRLGTTIPIEKGMDFDEFFLTFEVVGGDTNPFIEPDPVDSGDPVDNTKSIPEIGLRTFDEINASMSAITGVSMVESNVNATFETIKQQLPSVESIEGFLSSHQVAIAQLSIEYCNALVENTSLRSSFYPGFDFSASAQQAFDTSGERDLLIDPLLNRALGISVATQPDPAAVKIELNSLIDTLTACGGSCAADRTLTVAKATCAATIGSAAMLLQ
ncbi:MAG: LamG domain-containing protein [Candidatus Polarisedimenticolaceae bacterium]|nr:LamG domain-containing protein [Candidatus Polarisedimenticolaceae bacterium]